MNQRQRERIGHGVFSGLIFLALGVILLFGNFGLISARSLLHDWWPTVLVLVGIKHLLVWRGRLSWLHGLFWIATGTLFLTSTLGLFNIRVTSLLWPVMLIWFGVVITVGCSGCETPPISNRSES